MIKVGVIGCGKIAITRHLPEYASNPDAEIAGVYDFNLERAKEVAEQYQTRAYESVEEMLNDPQIEAVSVCVRNSDHSKVTVDALRAGKHVLCEKPMAVSLDECKEMVKTAEKTGKKLMIGHNQRFNRTHMKAKELIQNGAIGKVLSFKTTFGHGADRKHGQLIKKMSGFLIKGSLHLEQWQIWEYIKQIYSYFCWKRR